MEEKTKIGKPEKIFDGLLPPWYEDKGDECGFFYTPALYLRSVTAVV